MTGEKMPERAAKKNGPKIISYVQTTENLRQSKKRVTLALRTALLASAKKSISIGFPCAACQWSVKATPIVFLS